MITDFQTVYKALATTVLDPEPHIAKNTSDLVKYATQTEIPNVTGPNVISADVHR